MKHNESTKGRAKLLKWSTPAQFHFITDRYHDFNNTAGDRDKRTKFWKSLMKDWSSEWELNPKLEQKLRNYYKNMRGRTIRRLLSASSSTAHRALPRHSTSRSSSITTISPKSDEEIDELEPSTQPESAGANQAASPQRSHFQQSSIRTRMIPRSDRHSSVAELLEEDNIMIDVPGLKHSDIRAIHIGGNLLVRGEGNNKKGKNKENEVQRSPQLSNYIEAKIELPMGLQAEEVQVKFDAGRLTVQFPESSTLCTPITVDEIYEGFTSMGT